MTSTDFLLTHERIILADNIIVQSCTVFIPVVCVHTYLVASPQFLVLQLHQSELKNKKRRTCTLVVLHHLKYKRIGAMMSTPVWGCSPFKSVVIKAR